MPLQQTTHYAVALLALLALWAAAPGSTVAKASPLLTSSSDSWHPLVMQQAAHEVAEMHSGPALPFALQPHASVGGAAGTLRREVFGFALASSLVDPTIGYATW